MYMQKPSPHTPSLQVSLHLSSGPFVMWFGGQLFVWYDGSLVMRRNIFNSVRRSEAIITTVLDLLGKILASDWLTSFDNFKTNAVWLPVLVCSVCLRAGT